MIEANSGGPMSRTRVETIASSLLGRESGAVRCPRLLSLALEFGRRDPLRAIEKVLRARGFSDPEELRDEYELPPPMLCLRDPSIRALDVRTAAPGKVLRVALLLGLCTDVFFDPSRPVLWTEASLTRRVHLFDTAGFYA